MDIDFGQTQTLSGLLARLPGGEDARALATRLGVWTSSAHDGAAGRKKSYSTDFSRLTDHELSEVYGYWSRESARATELLGLLEGQKALVALEGKRARAAARGRVRRDDAADSAADAPKAPRKTVGEITDLAETDQAVKDADDTAVLLEVALASVKAYKEACLTFSAALSREISFRQAQMGAGLRA